MLEPTPQRPGLRLMTREVAPFGRDQLRFSGLPLVDNPDPVLAHLATRGEEEYRVMERSEPAVSSAKGQRVHTLLSAGSIVEAGPSGTRDAEDLKDWSIHFLKAIPKWPTVLRKMLDAVYYGWQPIHLVWTPTFTWRGRSTYWGLARALEKPQELFRFTHDRHLVHVGNGITDEPTVFRSPAQQMRWLVCTAGSLDSPYGDALFKQVWLIWYIKNRFLEMWATGMGRSLGILKAQEQMPAGTGLESFLPTVAGDGGDRKSLPEVAREVWDVLQLMSSNQVLVQRAGWVFEYLTNTHYAEGWRHPLEYCDELIRLAITHESLTLKVGDVGSKAAAETHRKGLIDLAKSDAKELEGWVNDGLLRRAIEWNFGTVDEDDLPRWRTKLGRSIDPERVSALHGAGVEVDWKAVAAD